MTDGWYVEGQRDLLIWSDGGLADLAPVKQAKAALGFEFVVKPVAVQPPGFGYAPPEGRILAIGSKPPWFQEYAFVTERTTAEGWQRALRWVLGTEEDPKATTAEDIMVSIFGPGAREITAEELESERLMDVYLNRTDEAD